MCNLISSTRLEYLKELIADARLQPNKQDDAFEGMIDDDAFIDGWFAVRKISGCVINSIVCYRFFCQHSSALFFTKIYAFYYNTLKAAINQKIKIRRVPTKTIDFIQSESLTFSGHEQVKFSL